MLMIMLQKVLTFQ